MPIASVNRHVNAPASQTWAVLNDFGSVHTFHPAVSHSERTNDAPMGLGAERTCQFDKGAIYERVVGYDPGHKLVIDVFETGPFPLKKGVATFTVDALDGGASRVQMDMDFTPKFGLLGTLMGPFMNAQFAKMMQGILDGLAEKTESQYAASDGNSSTEPAPLTAA